MRRLPLRALALALPLLLLGCPPRVKPGVTPILQPIAPPGTPTTAPPAGAPSTLAGALPLQPTGHNSEEQLAREMAALPEELRPSYEKAFRLTFCTDRGSRSPREARELLKPLLEARVAPAWRVQGYTFVDDGFQVAEAIRCYEEAIKADETYGPAHYALAFMLGQQEPQRGRTHFERAMALGVEDARGLKGKFYP